MRTSRRSGFYRCITTAACCLVFFLLHFVSPSFSFADSEKTSLSAAEQLRLGERMYREGILPSGEPMKAFVKGDPSVPGTVFSCESCHLRSGLGSVEDGVVTPAANGVNLFRPFQGYSALSFGGKHIVPRSIVEDNLKYYPRSPNRPTYTETTLAEVIRHGKTSSGRTLSDVMPRYLLEDREMKILISYLQSLSIQFSPGVSDTTIRFATILTEDVAPEVRNAMLVPLENFIRSKNETNFADLQSGIAGDRSRLMAEATFAAKGVAIRKLELARWVLKGAPETWRGQLEEYNRKEPVFALLGGIANGPWQPIHQFCEEHHLPSIFPMTDFPVISQTDWYSLYLSRGYYQEGEGAALFLNGRDELKDKPIVQIVRDTREGQTLSRGFLETWRDLGQKPPMTIVLKAGETLTEQELQRKLAQERPAAIILWDGSGSLKTLEMLAAGKNRPSTVLVSSNFLGKSLSSLEENPWDFVYLTYPYKIAKSSQDKTASSTGVKNLNVETSAATTIRISQQSYILTVILNMALLNMKGNYYRDNLLDTIGQVMDQDAPLYERLSFGSGQRYASKGCYIVQFTKSGLVKKSGWLQH
jgi:hypothetical protein